MRVVRDDEGRELLVLKESAESWLVRDPVTGRDEHRPAAELEPVEGRSPLEAVAETVPEALRRLVTAVPSTRGLGLLVTVGAREPLAVRDLQAGTEICESDLHGLIASFVAAGLLEETTVAGERGYRLTSDAREALGDVVPEAH